MLAMCASAANASSYPCFHADEQQSARIHDFQILMMVGALKCRDVAPGSVGRYAAMLSQRDQELASHGDRLLGRMIEEQGYREGRQAFDTYETTLSNHYSDRDLTRETCEDLGAYARMALEANPAELETLATLASRRTIDVCEAGGAARVIPPRTEPLVATYPDQAPVRVIRGAVPPQVAVARARVEAPAEFPDMVSAPVAEPVIEEQAPLAVQAADDAASGAARVAEAAVAEAAVAEAAANNASGDRLDAAITALDNAAQALRDLRSEQAPTK
jgi:hypothetical protein